MLTNHQKSIRRNFTTASRRSSLLPSTATEQPLASNAKAVALQMPALPPALHVGSRLG